MKNKFLKFLALALPVALLPVQAVYADDSTDYVNVNILGNVYYGTISDSEDGKNSVFTTVPDSDTQFTITGKWDEKNSEFTQKCTISYEDGTTQSVEYKKGLIQGDVRTDFADGTYQTFKSAAGKPYKALSTFSSSDEQTDIDWYFKCTLMNDWKEAAESIKDYNDLIENPYEYLDLPFTVEGTVDAVYEDSNQHTDIKVKDKDGNTYIFYYQSEAVNNYASANIPSLSSGDHLKITGVFSNLQDPEESSPLHLYEHITSSNFSLEELERNIQNDDFITAMDNLSQRDTGDESISTLQKMSEINDSDLEEAFPVFTAVTAEVDGDSCDPLHLQNTYQEICENPFYYIDADITLDGTVIYEDFDADSSKVILLVSQDGTSDIYAVSYKEQNFDTMLDEKVHCIGKLSNTHRTPYYNDDTKTLGYVTYPLITASEIE